MADSNGRTHIPDIKELTADLDGLRELVASKFESFRAIIDERDRRYEDRFTAMDEKTGLALTSSEKAVVKAETATEKRFDSVNEFRGSLKDQAATLISRVEVESKWKAYDDKIDDIKRDSRGQKNWAVALMITVAVGVMSIIITLVIHKP
jgi:hypothetical protein